MMEEKKSKDCGKIQKDAKANLAEAVRTEKASKTKMANEEAMVAKWNRKAKMATNEVNKKKYDEFLSESKESLDKATANEQSDIKKQMDAQRAENHTKEKCNKKAKKKADEEKKIAKQKKLSALLAKFVSTFDNPRNEMIFANKGTTHFALEQDRALLCSVNSRGYGNWDSVRESIRNDDRLKFQHTVQGMTTAMIGKRCDYRMRQMERELEAREKVMKGKRPANVIAAQKAIDAIKAMDAWETETRTRELHGEEGTSIDDLGEDAAEIIRERLTEREPCIDRLREIESQVSRCINVAEETRQGILRGDQVSMNFFRCTKAVLLLPYSLLISL